MRSKSPGASGWLTGKPGALDQRFEPLEKARVRLPERDREPRRGDHADGDGLAVRERVIGAQFERVADGVAEVEHVADALFVELILLDDARLQAPRTARRCR